MLDPITKYILTEGQMDAIDKQLDDTEKKVKDMPKNSADNMRSMSSKSVKELLNRFMFEYIAHDDCPPDHTKDPQTGKCSKNPHDEEVDDKADTMRGAGHANF